VSVVLIIGTGDMGERLAAGLAISGRVRRLVLALAVVAATVASVSDCPVEPVWADATRQDAVAELLARTRPDLVVQASACESSESRLSRTASFPPGAWPRGPAHRRRHGDHQGRMLSAARKVPVGPSSARVARVTMISAPCSTVLFPEWWLRSVARVTG
jgi:hypothetical protein